MYFRNTCLDDKPIKKSKEIIITYIRLAGKGGVRSEVEG